MIFLYLSYKAKYLRKTAFLSATMAPICPDYMQWTAYMQEVWFSGGVKKYVYPPIF